MIIIFQASFPLNSTLVGTNFVHRKNGSDAGYVTEEHQPMMIQSTDRSAVEKVTSSIETGISNQPHSYINNTRQRHFLAMPQQAKKGNSTRTSHSEPAGSDMRFQIDGLVSFTKSLSLSFDRLQQDLADQHMHWCQIETELDCEVRKLTDETERLKDQITWLETDRTNQAAKIRELEEAIIHLKAKNGELLQENAFLKQQLNTQAENAEPP